MATPAPDAVRRLVDRFDQNRDAYLSGSYNETQLRREFIDPLFEALGWDVENRQGSAMPYRDVIFEDSLKVGGATKAPDYCFRIGGMRKFFVEAKKPSVNIASDSSPAFQLRRYAWSAKLPLSILTDFEEFAVYDCRSRPVRTDKASTARIKLLRYSEYPDRWDELCSVFSPEAIRKGSFDKYVEDTKVRKGTAEVDDAFLAEIEGWRDSLARNIALRNPRLGTPDNTADLNLAVQMTIDRAIFLRICEDRGIEDYGTLQNLIGKPGVYRRLMERFENADGRYNSGLFDFRKDTITPSLKIDDKLLSDILSELYPPKSPYEFSVIGIEILGEVYEQFLGKVIKLTDGHRAKVEDKPEVRKAGGVHYTPQHIVNYIVKNTIGKLIADKTPAEIAKLAFLDKSCGSGSFLIGGYTCLLDYHLDWYVKHDPAKRPNEVFAIRPGEYLLTTAEKKRILLNNIYGVDIDPQAVEVTKLSLLLKVLEGENRETINSQLKLYHERALPNLDSNIKCGNSLIDSDFYRGQQGGLFDADIRRVNAFDWHKAFPEVMARGGFDADIGNPPWVMTAYHEKDTLDHLRRRYKSATGKFDLYYLFVELGVRLISDTGLLGMIIPNKFFHTNAAANLRALLAEGRGIRSIVDFGDEQVFKGATNYSSMLFLQKRPLKNLEYAKAMAGLKVTEEYSVPLASLGAEAWHFSSQRINVLFSKIEKEGTPLSALTARFGTGVQSGADRVLALDEETAGSLRIEKDVLRPVLRGRDVRRYGTPEKPKSLVFPYKVEGGRFVILTESEMERHKHLCRYLAGNRQRLGERVWFDKTATELSGKWYGMMYLDAWSSFESEHILTPSLSNCANFTTGKGTLFATGTAGVTSIIPKPDVRESILYLLGVLNSRLLSFYAIHHSPVFSGAYYKFSAPYLKKLPIRRIDFSNKADKARHDKMVELVTRMMELKKQQARAPKKQSPSARQLLDQKLAITDQQIDALVYDLYGLTEDEVRIVEGGDK